MVEVREGRVHLGCVHVEGRGRQGGLLMEPRCFKTDNSTIRPGIVDRAKIFPYSSR